MRQLVDSILDYRAQIKHMRESLAEHRAGYSLSNSGRKTNTEEQRNCRTPVQSIMRRTPKQNYASVKNISFSCNEQNADDDESDDSVDESINRMLFFQRNDNQNAGAIKDMVKFKKALTAQKLNIVPAYSHYDSVVKSKTAFQN